MKERDKEREREKKREREGERERDSSIVLSPPNTNIASR